MKVFLDTNVLASSIATRGLCSELLESVIHDHELLTCQPVLRELERVLAQKFRLPEAVVAEFLALLKEEGTVVLDLRQIEGLAVVSPRELWNRLAGLEPGSQK